MKHPTIEKDKLASFVAWYLAIEEKLQHPSSSTFRDLANQYGASITDQTCLDEVGKWFNWDRIGQALSKVDK